ncbi:MAG: ABC transporter permease, partial [Planctomycetia bacterium]|nr:ABC transporter permease [Planctomycetia bacterium]
MSPIRLILASLVYHRRTNLAVGLAVAAAAAVLTGALLVGDSMRGSLRHLTLDRLGRVDEVLVTDQFFRDGLADELARQPEFQQSFADAVPIVLLRASLENPAEGNGGQRAGRVNLIGCDERFWQAGDGGPSRLPGRQDIVLNRPLAQQLGVQVGDAVVLRLPR